MSEQYFSKCPSNSFADNRRWFLVIQLIKFSADIDSNHNMKNFKNKSVCRVDSTLRETTLLSLNANWLSEVECLQPSKRKRSNLDRD